MEDAEVAMGQPVPQRGKAGVTTTQLLQIMYERSAGLRGYVNREIPARFRGVVSAEDILQEVWIAAFQADRTAVRDWNQWITAAAQSRLVETLRTARTLKRGGHMHRANVVDARTTSYVDLFSRVQADTQTPSRELSAKEASQAVSIALAALPENKRRAVYLCHIEGLSRRETASRMGKSESAVNNLLYTGLRQLRELIGDASSFVSGVAEPGI